MNPVPAPGCGHGQPVLAGLVLAAGGAQRLGGRPKSLLELGGVPLVRRLVQALVAQGVGPVVVVTGCHAPAVRRAVQDLPVRVENNPDWAQGPTGSVRAGLATLAGLSQSVLVALADMPAIGLAELKDLERAWCERPPATEVLVPWVAGARGNPVVMSGAVRDAVLTDVRWPSPRDWQAAHPDRVHRWNTGNVAYRLDIDTPDDLARFNATHPQPLLWPAGWEGAG